MTDVGKKRTDDELILTVDVPDAWLEAAALNASAGAYTQFGLCTVSLCPGAKATAAPGARSK
jgi:hypothetical protein